MAADSFGHRSRAVLYEAMRLCFAELDGPLVEVPQATVETIDGTPAKSERGKKTRVERPAPAAKTKPDNEKKVSQIDAALKVLRESTEPMTTRQMVEQTAAKGYWSSSGGKTPHATLYSAIFRELQTKGDESRFVKTDRGHFRLRTA